MCGTDEAYRLGSCYAMSGTDMAYGASCLRACFAMPGPETAYAQAKCSTASCSCTLPRYCPVPHTA
eukprot:1545341-Rhodomonas_salina.2